MTIDGMASGRSEKRQSSRLLPFLSAKRLPLLAGCYLVLSRGPVEASVSDLRAGIGMGTVGAPKEGGSARDESIGQTHLFHPPKGHLFFFQRLNLLSPLSPPLSFASPSFHLRSPSSSRSTTSPTSSRPPLTPSKGR